MAKRSAGGVALSQTGKSYEQIGATIGGRTKVTVGRWISGERSPSDDDRKLMLEHFGIAPPSWDEEPQRKAPKPSVDSETRLARSSGGLDDVQILGDAMASLRGILEEVETELEQLREDRQSGRGTPVERRRGLRELGNLSLKISEAARQFDLDKIMMQLPSWKRVESELRDVLREHPEVARVLAERFEALDRSR